MSATGAADRVLRRSASGPCRPLPPRAWLVVVGLSMSVHAGLSSARAQSFEPGSGVFVAGGGFAGSGTTTGIASIGQTSEGVATNGSWSFWTGILMPFARALQVQIMPDAPEVATAGAPIPIEATVVPAGQVESVTLRYREGGRSEYLAREMTAGGSGPWKATIPGGDVTLRGVEFYVEVRVAGRTAHSPAGDYEAHPWRIPVDVTDSDGSGALSTMARTYRMISFPAILPEEAPSPLIDDLGQPDPSLWRCGTWDPNSEAYLEVGHDAVEPFTPGHAAWLITEQARSIDFTGQTVFPSTDMGRSIPLRPGWNQIGDPFAYAVALADILVDDGKESRTFVQAVDDGLLEAQPLHRYDGTAYRTDPTTLSPWTGYFVANLTAGDLDLIVPPREASSECRPKVSSPRADRSPDWLLTMRALESADGAAALGPGSAARADDGAAICELGTAMGALDGWDRWDLLRPPSIPDCRRELRAVNKTLPQPLRALQRDIKPAALSGATWTVEVVTCAAGLIALHWETSGVLPSGCSARLLDRDHRTWVEVSPVGSYVTTSAGPGLTTLTIAMGTNDWLDQQCGEAAPAGGHFAASVLGGNPSRGGVNVRLVLEQAESVSLRVYDVQGRLRRTLPACRLAPGVHALRWDGRTDDGAVVPPGVYFLRVAGPEHEVNLRGILVR